MNTETSLKEPPTEKAWQQSSYFPYHIRHITGKEGSDEVRKLSNTQIVSLANIKTLFILEFLLPIAILQSSDL